MEPQTLDLQTADVATLRQLPREELAEELAAQSSGHLAALFTRLGDEALAELIAELEPEYAEAILVEMQPDEAGDVRELLTYPPETAGGIMTPEYVAVAPDLTADQALVALRRVAEEAETIYYIYVTDPDTERLLGVLSLRNLVLSRPTTPVRELMVTDIAKIRADADQEEAARLLDQQNLI